MEVAIKSVEISLSQREARALKLLSAVFHSVSLDHIRTNTPKYNDLQTIEDAKKLANDILDLAP